MLMSPAGRAGVAEFGGYTRVIKTKHTAEE